jgi:hypothetical protein
MDEVVCLCFGKKEKARSREFGVKAALQHLVNESYREKNISSSRDA